jgi:hypothetical protein
VRPASTIEVEPKELLFTLTLRRMRELMREEPAQRSARRLVNDVSRQGLDDLVYGTLLPLIARADRAPWEAVEAAMVLGMALEQLRRRPLIVQDEKRQAVARERNLGDRWLAEVEGRPAGTTVERALATIGEAKGRDLESVERTVARARAKRRKKLTV